MDGLEPEPNKMCTAFGRLEMYDPLYGPFPLMAGVLQDLLERHALQKGATHIEGGQVPTRLDDHLIDESLSPSGRRTCRCQDAIGLPVLEAPDTQSTFDVLYIVDEFPFHYPGAINYFPSCRSWRQAPTT